MIPMSCKFYDELEEILSTRAVPFSSSIIYILESMCNHIYKDQKNI